jgi:hypothetical protein
MRFSLTSVDETDARRAVGRVGPTSGQRRRPRRNFTILRHAIDSALYSSSIRGTVAAGPRTGRKVTRFGDRIAVEDIAVPAGPRCAAVSGFSVHANVAVPARDRNRLERLCRYVARPPVATERLSLLPDGRVAYALKNPYRDGSTHVVFEPLDFVAKLAALVPPSRFNLVRYHGVLAPAARIRAQVIPEGAAPDGVAPAHPGCRTPHPPAGRPEGSTAERNRPRPRNYSWAELMRRVWEVDVLECPACRSRMRVLCSIHSIEAIRAILECLGLPSRAPPISLAAAEPELDGTDLDSSSN